MAKWKTHLSDIGGGHLVTGVFLFAIALLFAWNTAGKLLNPNPTIEVLTSVWQFSYATARLLFVFLLVAEAATVLLILSKANSKVAIIVSIAMLLLFSTSIVNQIHQGNNLSCGCGFAVLSMSARQSQWYSLGQNLVFIILLIAACLSHSRKPQTGE